MIRQTVLTLSASLALASLPQTALAYCSGVAAGSATVSCESGVMVVRQAPGRMPTIDPTTSAKLDMQRQARIDRLNQQARKNALAERKLDIEEERVRNQGYLYRDAYSPLRQRIRPLGYGTRGIRSGRGVIVLGGR